MPVQHGVGKQGSGVRKVSGGGAREQRSHLVAQFLVSGAFRGHKCGALGGFQFERAVEYLANATPTLGRHVPPRRNSRDNQAFADAQSRLAVISDMPSAWALSSTLKPAKKRSSTRRAWRGSMAARRVTHSSTASTSSSGSDVTARPSSRVIRCPWLPRLPA